jgi:hypothetical protein
MTTRGYGTALTLMDTAHDIPTIAIMRGLRSTGQVGAGFITAIIVIITTEMGTKVA